MLDGIKQPPTPGTPPRIAPAAAPAPAASRPSLAAPPPIAQAPAPPQEAVHLRALPAGSSAAAVKLPPSAPVQQTPEARLAQFCQAGKVEEAGAVLRQYSRSASPAERAEFAALLKKADAKASLAYLRQEGFIKEAGVFPFDFGKLSHLKAAEVTSLIGTLSEAQPKGQHKDVIAALSAKGATGLNNESEKAAFVRKVLVTGRGTETLKNLSEQIKAAPRYTQELDKAVGSIAAKMSDKDLKTFLKATEYYQTGTEGYGETNPDKLKHFSKDTLASFYSNLNQGDWGDFWKYLNLPQRELVSDLKDLL